MQALGQIGLQLSGPAHPARRRSCRRSDRWGRQRRSRPRRRDAVAGPGLGHLHQLIEDRAATAAPPAPGAHGGRARARRWRDRSSTRSAWSGPASTTSPTLVRKRRTPPSAIDAHGDEGRVLHRDLQLLDRGDQVVAVGVEAQHGGEQAHQRPRGRSVCPRATRARRAGCGCRSRRNGRGSTGAPAAGRAPARSLRGGDTPSRPAFASRRHAPAHGRTGHAVQPFRARARHSRRAGIDVEPGRVTRPRGHDLEAQRSEQGAGRRPAGRRPRRPLRLPRTARSIRSRADPPPAPGGIHGDGPQEQRRRARRP